MLPSMRTTASNMSPCPAGRHATGANRLGHTLPMDVLTVIKWFVAVLGAVGGPAIVVNLVRSAFPDVKERLRAEIERNADLMAKLPENGKAHEILEGSIERDLERLSTELEEARRDPLSVGLGIVFLGGAVGAVVWASLLGGWVQAPVWILAAVLALFGVVGIAQGAPQTLRDEKGNPLK